MSNSEKVIYGFEEPSLILFILPVIILLYLLYYLVDSILYRIKYKDLSKYKKYKGVSCFGTDNIIIDMITYTRAIRMLVTNNNEYKGIKDED